MKYLLWLNVAMVLWAVDLNSLVILLRRWVIPRLCLLLLQVVPTVTGRLHALVKVIILEVLVMGLVAFRISGVFIPRVTRWVPIPLLRELTVVGGGLT